VPPDLPYADAFDVAGARYGVAPSLLAAIGRVGTGFRADASTATGGGLMQLRPAVAAELHVDATVPYQAVDGAARRLADLWNRLHDVRLVLAAYHSSVRTVNDPSAVPRDDATETFVNAVLSYATT
jgi:soluble lytic murein transglycosylase-like protein